MKRLKGQNIPLSTTLCYHILHVCVCVCVCVCMQSRVGETCCAGLCTRSGTSPRGRRCGRGRLRRSSGGTRRRSVFCDYVPKCAGTISDACRDHVDIIRDYACFPMIMTIFAVIITIYSLIVPILK